VLSFSGGTKVLHLSWLAFFISFAVWFNHAPLMASIRASAGLSDQQVSALLIMNLALTIPARVVIGMIVDKWGPRVTYSALLIISGLLCFFFASAHDFATLAASRFLLGLSGAGFVVGIRIIGEWFPARQMGFAQGIYAGLGNFGSAGAALTLPLLAYVIGGADGWRWAIAVTGVIAIVYGIVYYMNVTDTPKGATYFKAKKAGAMEVSNSGDLILYIIMQLPMVLALALLTWQLGPDKLKLFPEPVVLGIYGLLTALFLWQAVQIWRINGHVFKAPVPEIERYSFAQVALMCLMYLVTFGGELAIVSMLPLFFKDNFDLSLAAAGTIGACFGATNLFARPLGGWFCDKYGRKPVLIIVAIGFAAGCFAMSTMGKGSSLYIGIAVTMAASIFGNAANGAVYSVLPIIKRRLTGQIAGLAGAFGNVGGVLFLSVLSLTGSSMFFMAIAAGSAICLIGILIIFREPKGAIAEVNADGSLTMIEVA
jgi:NNP family nitrate/nitrite transporter-like MFS transporter